MNLLQRHYFVFIGAFLVALFAMIPYVNFFQRVGDSFAGIYPELNGDTLFYHARIRDVLDGYKNVYNPYFAEHKEGAHAHVAYAERFVAGLVSLFNTSIQQLQLIMDVVAPVVIFVLGYILFYLIFPNRLLAFIAPLLLFTIVTGGLYKPIHPQITFPLLLFFLIFWVKLVAASTHFKKWLYSALCGIAFGLLINTYFFHWTFVVVVVGLYGIALLVKKDLREIKYYVLMVAIAIIIGLPYFFLVAQGFDSPLYAETAVRMGLYKSHLPETLPRLAVAVLWLCLFVFFVRFYPPQKTPDFSPEVSPGRIPPRKEHFTSTEGFPAGLHKFSREPLTLVVASLLMANILYPNHQIITNTIIQNAVHWSFMPIFIFALATQYMLGILFDQLSHVLRYRRFATAVVIIFFLVPTIRFMTFSYPALAANVSQRTAAESQRYGAAIQWINTHTQKDDVIFSNLSLMRLVSTYTYDNVYYSEYGYVTPASDQEIVERTLLSHFFEPSFFADDNFGMTEDARIVWTQPAQSERTTHRIYDLLRIPYTRDYSLERERALAQQVYNNLQHAGWTPALLKRYRVDYIIWDEAAQPEWNLDRYEEFVRADSLEGIAGITVWKFKD